MDIPPVSLDPALLIYWANSSAKVSDMGDMSAEGSKDGKLVEARKQRDQSSKVLVSFCNIVMCKKLVISLLTEPGASPGFLAFLEILSVRHSF